MRSAEAPPAWEMAPAAATPTMFTDSAGGYSRPADLNARRHAASNATATGKAQNRRVEIVIQGAVVVPAR